MGGTYRLYGLRQIPQSVDKEAHASFFYALGYLLVVPVSNYSSHNKSVDEKIFFYERIFIGDRDFHVFFYPYMGAKWSEG